LLVALVAVASCLPVRPSSSFWNATVSNAIHGVDVSSDVYGNTFSCLKSNNYGMMIVRAWHSTGVFDDNAIHTLYNALDAGITDTNVYLFPCKGKDAASQMNGMIAGLAASAPYPAGKTDGYDRIWLDIETNPSSGCGWGSDLSSNCQFIKELLDAATAKGKKVGVYTSKYMWEGIAGSSCTVGAGYPLWYPHYDFVDSCSDFTSFGGWTSPTIKQFSDRKSICGITSDADVYC